MKRLLIYLLVFVFTACNKQDGVNNSNPVMEPDEQFSDLKKWSATPFEIRKEESLLVTEWLSVIFSKPPHNIRFEYKDANIDQQKLISIPAGSYHRIDLLNMVSTKSGFAYNFDENGVLIISAPGSVPNNKH